MIFKSLVAATLGFAATSLFAATPVVRSIQTTLGDAQDKTLFRVSSSVCVGNVDVDKTIAVQYRYGADGEWKTEQVEKYTQLLFSQRYPTDMQPDVLTVKFLTRDGADAPELTYDLAQTETRFTPGYCDNLENYLFQKTDATELTVDLVHVGQ